MNIKISDELSQIVRYSKEEAIRTGSYSIEVDHLFLGILRHKENVACDTLRALGVDLHEFKKFIESKLWTKDAVPYSDIDKVLFSRDSQNILSLTVLEANRTNCHLAKGGHLLLALLMGRDCYGLAYLDEIGLDYSNASTYMDHLDLLKDNDYNEASAEPTQPSQPSQPQQPAKPQKPSKPAQEPQMDGAEGESQSNSENEQNMVSFGIDITKMAQDGVLDPVIGREDEIDRVIQILGRRKKNNVMLVGEPGVGKTSIIEGIATRIALGQVPEEMRDTQIISLDLAAVVAGTRFRGDFEQRLKDIIKQLSSDPYTILFIDEFHTIVGAGSTSGSLDAANILKPALARGEIHCIGATTFTEFQKIIKKDAALYRRFEKVVVEPTTTKQTITILESIKDIYEAHHHVKYTPEALVDCVRMADRYISDRHLPDKAIDLLDEAGSIVHLKHAMDKSRSTPKVTSVEIAALISKQTGIPAGYVAESESTRLRNLTSAISAKVIGQDEAVQSIASAIKRNRAGLKDPRRPIGTFLFVGQTGVGKTRLAKVLAEYLFDSEDNMIRLDMSEYGEKFNISRLIGAPPGYVGYDEGGQLTERVRRKPYSVVLLDEIEKAHPDIYNLLLQIVDEGRLTDSNGREIDFRNTVIILTSNVGSRESDEYGSGLGFTKDKSSVDATKKSIIEKNIRKTFPPELLGRIDEQIFFNPLTREDIEKIIDIELREVRTRAAEFGIKLQITSAAKKIIAEAGYDARFGARPLKRAIRKYVEDPVSEYILEHKLNSVKPSSGKQSKVLKVGVNKLEIHLSDYVE